MVSGPALVPSLCEELTLYTALVRDVYSYLVNGGKGERDRDRERQTDRQRQRETNR